LTESSVKICHIDVDVYQSAKDIFTWVWPRLIPGGVVIFDDFGFGACEGITQLVNEITSENPQIRRIYNINGHGILFKIGAG
jgi:O-methyltransferase